MHSYLSLGHLHVRECNEPNSNLALHFLFLSCYPLHHPYILLKKQRDSFSSQVEAIKTKASLIHFLLVRSLEAVVFNKSVCTKRPERKIFPSNILTVHVNVISKRPLCSVIDRRIRSAFIFKIKTTEKGYI